MASGRLAKKRVLLIGGYQRARALQEIFAKKNYKVTMVNDNYAQCKELATLKGVNAVFGEGTRPYVLADADAYGANLAVALTHCDEDNLVICELCKKKFGVKKTMAIIGDPNKAEFFKKMGVDFAVSSVGLVGKVVEQNAFMEDISSVAEIGDVNILQVPLLDDSPAIGKRLMDTRLPQNTLIGCVMREGKNIIPNGQTVLQKGDTLLLLSLEHSEEEAVKQLTGKSLQS
ncbi:MAG: NAD-binding protein [Firmicutes bacterium]|nr:NAD-binding protein [Bacillota bacterium]